MSRSNPLEALGSGGGPGVIGGTRTREDEAKARVVDGRAETARRDCLMDMMAVCYRYG